MDKNVCYFVFSHSDFLKNLQQLDGHLFKARGETQYLLKLTQWHTFSGSRKVMKAVVQGTKKSLREEIKECLVSHLD